MFEFVTDLFGGDSKKAATPAPVAAEPAAPAPAPAAAQLPAQDHAAAPTPAAPTTPATGAAPDPTAHKPVDQKACADAANTIFKKMDGWWVSGSDKSAVLDTLRGKSPDEVAAIKASYAEHFPGHDMDKDVGKNLDGKDLTEAKASMSGDPVAASVAAIKNAETGTFFGNVDSDKVTKVLEGISDPKVRAEVAKQVGGEVSSMQSGNDKELTQALLTGDTAKANAVKIDSSMHSTGYALSQFVNNHVAGGLLGKDFGLDKDSINGTLESVKDPAQRQKMLDDYKAKTGQDLRTELASKQEGANKDVSNKLLDGDVAAANAARVKAATESFFTDKDAIYKAMEGKTPAERTAMMADYKTMYGDKGGDLDKTLKDNLSGLDLQKAQELKDQGKLDDAFAMKYAMEGSFWSTDKTLLKKTLDGKSKEEIAKLSGEYQQKYGIDLQGELGQTTSGRDGFEIKELMKGEPKTLDEKMDRSRARYDFERGSGSNVVSKAFVDTFSDKGQMLDAQNARMEDLYKKIQSGGASTDEKALLDRVTGYQGQDVKTYQENKDSVANGAAAVAAIAASTAATIAPGGAAAPAEVAIIAALCGGGATIATKAIIQDSGYSNEELRNDLIMTGVNAATGGAMGALGSEGGALFNMAGKITDNAVAQQMLIQGMSGAVTSGVGGATQTMLAGGDAKAMLKAGGMGALSGGVTGAVTGGVGAGLKGNQMFEGMDPVKAAMLRNAIAGGTGGVAGLAVTPDAYSGDSAALIQKWGLAVGGGAAGGLAGGYNEGTMEVQNAKALQTQEQLAAQAKGGTLPTADEKVTLAQARENAENPAEAQKINQVEADLAAGKNPKLPVEEPGNAKTAPNTSSDVEVKAKAPVEEPGVPVEAPAKTPEEAAQRTDQREAVTSNKLEEPNQLRDQVDAVTGVDKGPEYSKFKDDMKAFYANQEIEAQNVTEVSTHRLDPRTDGSAYGIDGKYDARTFTYDNGNLTQLSMDVHLAQGSGVQPNQVEQIRQNAIEGVDKFYNFKEDGGRLHQLPNGDKMQVEVNFVDKPAGADLVVGVEQPGIDPRTGQERFTVQNEWLTGTDSRVAAHELGHQMGLLDEYVDPSTVNRGSLSGPGVKTDGSLMGNFYTDGLPTEVKQRSIDQIGNDITNAGHSAPTTATAAPAPSEQQILPAPAPGQEGDVGLSNLGVRPEAGTRTMTREEYYAQDSRERAIATVADVDQPLENNRPNAAKSGHGHERHGWQTTDDQQANRVETGRYPADLPIGPLPRRQNPAERASRFGSPEAEAEALGRGRRELDTRLVNDATAAATAGDPAPTYRDPRDNAPRRIESTVSTNRPDGFGPAQTAGVDANGNRIAVPDPTRNGTATISWEFVPSINDWRPVTYYPEP